MIIGSANFTRAGLTANAELVGLYEIDIETTPQHLPLFQQATQFLLAIANRWPNPDLDSNLHEMTDDAPWLIGDGTPYHNTDVRFAHNLDEPLWAQLCRGVSAPVDEFHALSRFFDAEPTLLDSVDSSLKPKRTILWTQSGITTMTPSWFGHSGIRTKRVTVRDCSIADDDQEQPLHAKAVAIANKQVVRLGFGSANFSSAGLLSTAATGNVETMIVIDNASAKLCDPHRLFDPCANAKPLTRVAGLLTVEPEPPPRPRDCALLLAYARLTDKRLKCVWSSHSALASDVPVRAVLTFGDGGEDRVVLHRQGESSVTDLDDRQVRRCAEGATVIWVEALVKNGASLRSNQMFVMNLQDIETGRGQRRERRIREAQKSAVQFAMVLQELMELPDSDQLQTFLTYCDIPVIDSPRPLWARGARPPWQDMTPIRSLGQRNLRAYASLHQAAVGFCNRHVKRMRRHCERVSLAGVPNFFHIAMAIANVVRAQVERLLTGLELTTQPLNADEWHEHRQRLAEYLGIFRDVMEVIHAEYLPSLQKRFKAQLVREAIQPDVQPLGEICGALRQVRSRIEFCRSTNLRVMLPTGGVTIPGVFRHDIVHETRWPEWEATIEATFEKANAFARSA